MKSHEVTPTMLLIAVIAILSFGGLTGWLVGHQSSISIRATIDEKIETCDYIDELTREVSKKSEGEYNRDHAACVGWLILDSKSEGEL